MKWKEPVKSVCLFFLIILMILLFMLNWVYRLDREEIMRGGSWVTGFARFFGIIRMVDQASLSVEVIPAAYPLKMAARSDGGLYSVQYDREALRDFYRKTTPVMAGALENAQEWTLSDKTEYQDALSKQMIYFGFDGEIPFYVFGEWLGVSDGDGYDFTARHIVLCDDNGFLSVFISGKNGASVYKIKTSAPSAPLHEILSATTPDGSFFAYEGGSGYQSIEPETILFAETPKIRKIKGAAPAFVTDGQNAQTLIEAFGYNPYTVKSYGEGNGTFVYVENLSTLRIGTDGTVYYYASDIQGGIPVSGMFSGEDDSTATVRMIEAARFLVDSASADVRNDAEPYLEQYRFDETDRTYTVTFGMEVSGVPIFYKEGPAAEIKIRDGIIYSAVLRLRAYTTTDAVNYLMPQKQAVSSYLPKEEINGAFWVRYEDMMETDIRASFYFS